MMATSKKAKVDKVEAKYPDKASPNGGGARKAAPKPTAKAVKARPKSRKRGKTYLT